MSSFWRHFRHWLQCRAGIKMTTFNAASDGNFNKMTTFPFRWISYTCWSRFIMFCCSVDLFHRYALHHLFLCQWGVWIHSTQLYCCTSPTMHKRHIPQCTILWQKCAHFYWKMVHCGIFGWCIVGFVRWHITTRFRWSRVGPDIFVSVIILYLHRLTYCDLVMTACNVMHFCRHWFGQWPGAWQNQALSLTSDYLSSIRQQGTYFN